MYSTLSLDSKQIRYAHDVLSISLTESFTFQKNILSSRSLAQGFLEIPKGFVLFTYKKEDKEPQSIVVSKNFLEERAMNM